MTNLWIKYGIFAACAICANLIVQYLVFALYHGAYEFYAAIGAGTLVGLLTKYLLDKKYIFMYSALAIWEDMRTFVLYSATGVITTFIFWGVEFAFYFLFSFPLARYIGGMIGLIIGYFLKYNLDKKFVFIKYIFKK